MSQRIADPGALLVVLRRRATSSDVLVLPPNEAASDGAGTGDEQVLPGLPWTAARPGRSQWELAEQLVLDHVAGGVDRLYASTLRVGRAEAPLGVFVAFVDDPGEDRSSETAFGQWRDLRTAARELPADSGALLSDVRERFIATTADEALRMR